MYRLNNTPLSSLRAVEAIGRLGTLSRAAGELGVTPGAVSQRLAKAEAILGHQLFVRCASGLQATEVCIRILPDLTAGMKHLSDALSYLDDRETNLTVSVAPIFASRWLIWRIHRFHDQEPAINVRVEPRAEMASFQGSEVDVGIRVGPSPGPNLDGSKLLDQRVFPVCSPEIARRIQTIDDVFDVPIIRENDIFFGWTEWLAHFGHKTGPFPAGPTYVDASLCLDAAMTGQGVFMAWETLACDAIEAGQLVAPLPGRVETGQSYWFVVNPRTAKSPKTCKFQKWLQKELGLSILEWDRDSSLRDKAQRTTRANM